LGRNAAWADKRTEASARAAKDKSEFVGGHLGGFGAESRALGVFESDHVDSDCYERDVHGVGDGGG